MIENSVDLRKLCTFWRLLNYERLWMIEFMIYRASKCLLRGQRDNKYEYRAYYNLITTVQEW